MKETKHQIWYAKNKDTHNEKRKQEYKDNEELSRQARERSAKWRKENPEKVKQQQKSYRERNRNKVKTNQHNYRARKTNAFVENVSMDIVFERDKGKCYLCGDDVKRVLVIEPKMATLDHVIPLNKGGLHCYDNIKLCCHKCNCVKRDSIPQEGIQMSLFAQPGLVQKKIKKKQTPEEKKAYMKKYREKNKESLKEYDKKKRELDRPENWESRIKFAHLPIEERKKIWQARYREKNREKVNAANRERRAKNKELGIPEWKPDPEVSKAYFKAYNEKNRAKKSEYDKERYKKLGKSESTD